MADTFEEAADQFRRQLTDLGHAVDAVSEAFEPDAPRYPDGSIVMDAHATRENVARMAAEIERLRAAIQEVHADCIGRMPLSRDGKTVPIGASAWLAVCDALKKEGQG